MIGRRAQFDALGERREEAVRELHRIDTEARRLVLASLGKLPKSEMARRLHISRPKLYEWLNGGR